MGKWCFQICRLPWFPRNINSTRKLLSTLQKCVSLIQFPKVQQFPEANLEQLRGNVFLFVSLVNNCFLVLKSCLERGSKVCYWGQSTYSWQIISPVSTKAEESSKVTFHFVLSTTQVLPLPFYPIHDAWNLHLRESLIVPFGDYFSAISVFLWISNHFFCTQFSNCRTIQCNFSVLWLVFSCITVFDRISTISWFSFSIFAFWIFRIWLSISLLRQN